MSVISLSDFINCDNKNLSIESLFKGLIASSSSGTLYLRTDASIYSANANVSKTFTQADLVNVTILGVVHSAYLFTHNFGTNSYDFIVKDNNGNGFMAQDSYINNNSAYIIIDSVITGTYTIDAWTI
jgi:hypothetical protein